MGRIDPRNYQRNPPPGKALDGSPNVYYIGKDAP
jgi:hypothetical protein